MTAHKTGPRFGDNERAAMLSARTPRTGRGARALLFSPLQSRRLNCRDFALILGVLIVLRARADTPNQAPAPTLDFAQSCRRGLTALLCQESLAPLAG